MNIFVGVLVCIIATIVVIFVWEVLKNIFFNLYRKESIDEVMEDIIDCLDIADALEYETIFRTPECNTYKDCKLHIANTEDGKEVIMIDLI